ncbi:MAG: VCBS repeat-containing protein [Betaproteobacteria bacterium]|nr:VCBS repeat-containing protein [Betaproteobacteria bacterium]
MNFKIFAVLLSVFGLVSCGPSGSASDSVTYVDGWPIYTALAVGATSYANKNASGLTRTQVPIDAVSGKTLVPTSVTFGDFFQEGQYSAFVVSTDNKAYFLRWKTSTSAWVDDSARLFGTGSRDTCSATYAITADFNSDSKPDVFLSCSGTSNQLMFVSSGSSYVRTDTQIAVDGNRAAATDINGDGILDLVLTNRNAVPQIWKGNTGGLTFTYQPAWLVTSTCSGATLALPTNIDSTFVVPSSTGSVDLILGGVAAVGGQPYIQMQKQSTVPYFTTCNGYAKGFQQIYDTSNNVSALRDIFFQSSKFYVLTQSSVTSQIQLTSYTINSDTPLASPVFSATQRLSESASGAGLPQQYKYSSSGYFQPFEAGCALNRCATSANITPP